MRARPGAPSALLLSALLPAALLLSAPTAHAAPVQSGSNAQQVSDFNTPAVAPDDAVITIHGFCADRTRTTRLADFAPQGPTSSRTTSSPLDPCETVITRAQFDRLADALLPNMPRPLRLKVAASYARMMRMAAVAEKRGLDQTPAFAEELRYARLQLLSQDLSRVLEEEAQHISDTEVADYYHRHQPDFEQATLERIFVPASKRAPPATPARKSPDLADLTDLATALRRRAAAGESPESLQTEAFKAAGMSVPNPHTKLEKVLRNSLPPNHETVMDLNTGEVSEVLSDPGGGHFIYKMIQKSTPTLEELAPEIRKRISTQRYRQSTESFEGDVVFNDSYFDPPSPERASAPRARRPRGARRSSAP